MVITTKPFTGKKQICQPFQNYVIDIPWYFGQSYGGGQKILWEGSFTWQILVRKLTPLWILGSHYFCQGKGCKYSGKSKSHLKLWASWHSLRARWNIIWSFCGHECHHIPFMTFAKYSCSSCELCTISILHDLTNAALAPSFLQEEPHSWIWSRLPAFLHFTAIFIATVIKAFSKLV